MRKCRKSFIVKNYYNEIDYEKLANAIVRAQELKDIKDNEEFKKAKPSIKAKILMAILALLAVIFLLFAIVNFVEHNFIDGAKLFLIVTMYALLFYSEYIMSKTKNRSVVFNIASIIIALTSFIFAIISEV